ncbi:MCE family protein [Pseudonocardia eucalypti]|uniref:MCE family protein n=1 Tax=Pseudonocardia eucalypti TaxID=648755 RepID=A0ABP9PHL0_9PSEU|nr:phospholipid/cholesterol/gamma-HCH transport system substrate-binding protein [Pseudonocardia eucalypti]
MSFLRGLGGPLTKFLIFAVVTLMCTAVLAGTIANRVGGDQTTYYAKFTDATGVNKGDEVRVAGVRVGQVDEITVADNKLAQLEFSVRKDLVLPSTTRATIKFRNLVGQRYIALEQGPGKPGERLMAGATLPVEQTRPSVNLTQLFNGFRPLLQALSPQDVNQLSFELVRVLQGEGGTVQSLLSHTASLTSTIADKDRVIGEVINNLNLVLDTVNARDAEFTQLVITVRELVQGLSKDRNTIGEAVESLGDLTDATADLLHDARPPLKDDIKHLGELAENLNDNEKILSHFLATLPKKLDILIPLGTHGGWFNFYLCDLSGTLTLPDALPPPLGGLRVELPVIKNPAERCIGRNPDAPEPIRWGNK